MKPITDFEKEVVALNRYKWALSEDIKRKAQKTALPTVAVRYKNKVTVCLNCGNSMVYHGECGKAVCLGCGKTVNVIDRELWRASGHRVKGTFSTVREYQGRIELRQTFEVIANYNPDTNVPKYSFREICRHWRNTEGEEAVTALPYIFGKFIYFGKLKLRRKPLMVYEYFANNAPLIPAENQISPKDIQEMLDTIASVSALSGLRNFDD